VFRQVTFKGKLKSILLEGLHKALDVPRVFATNGQVINPLNNDHTMAGPQTRTNVSGLESLLAEGLGQVLKKETWSDVQPTETLNKLEASKSLMGALKATRQMQKCRRLVRRWFSSDKGI
jgi:hypothetical protein